MKSAVQVLQRWIALDAALLSADGVLLDEFADAWDVDVKTVRRDAKALKVLGQRASWDFEIRDGKRECVWRYRKGTLPLFTRNCR
jgi:hypothetical protein